MNIKPKTEALILEAAEKEFLEKGYEGAYLREIAKKAGVTTGALYGYFKNKEELFGAIVGTQYNKTLSMFDEVLDEFKTLPPEQQAQSMQEYSGRGMRLITEYIYDNWNAFRLILCYSEGTSYNHLVEEMTEKEIRATADFSSGSRDAGIPLKNVNQTLGNRLVYGLFSTFFDIVRYELPREETDSYIEQLLDFYISGWIKLWGY